MASSALDSLTATYTDSEGEEEKSREERDEEDIALELAPSLADRLKEGGVSTPGSNNSARSSPKRTHLVDYNDPDAGLSDDDRKSEPMDLESEDEDSIKKEAEGPEKEERSHIMEELWVDGVKLPPEPPGNCNRELQEKVEIMWRSKIERGKDFNYMIQNKKGFRNPSIYEKLIIHLNIDELGTNFPPELYDGHLFGKESYYEELAKQQKLEMEKREKAIAAAAGEAKSKDGTAGQNALRKSKWDQSTKLVGSADTLVSTTLSKVIPAFGSLKKK